MPKLPTHTPYGGSSKPFTVGLKPLDIREWIEIDADLPAYLAEKDRLLATAPGEVHVDEPGTEEAQREVLALLAAHLLTTYPETYSLAGPHRIAISGRGGIVDVGPDTAQPLKAAARLVAEDLILMRKDDSGWRLAAGSLCFPSSWSLTEKFGRPLHEIHAPVPAFGPGTRTADIIRRIFDNLAVEQPVLRFNWSLQAGNDLYLPFSHNERVDRATSRPSKFHDDEAAARAFIRVERQTLRKLPMSQDILFTIRIHLDPLAVLDGHPERAALSASFAAQLEAMDEAQLDYKGLTADRDRLARLLRGLAARG